MRSVFYFAFLFACISVQAKTIRVAAIDWCPQICVDGQQEGYVMDLVREIYKDTGYRLDIQYLPWSRAIKYVLSGKADALLSPAKAEAPDLIYPEYEVGEQKMCFYTRKESDWHYTGPDSLANMQIGIAMDSSIEELNDYVQEHLEQFQFQPYHDRYLIQNAHKLDKNRMDAFLFTRNSTKYILSRANEWWKYREAGCVSTASIYMAFTPAKHLEKEIREMLKVFERRMQEIHETRFTRDLLERYGLSD